MRSWKYVLGVIFLFPIFTFGCGKLASWILASPGDPWDADESYMVWGIFGGLVLWAIFALVVLVRRTTHQEAI